VRDDLSQEGSENHIGGTAAERDECMSCGAMHSCNPHQKQSPGSSDFCLHFLTNPLIDLSLACTRLTARKDQIFFFVFTAFSLFAGWIHLLTTALIQKLPKHDCLK